jgi:hypothetical protein
MKEQQSCDPEIVAASRQLLNDRSSIGADAEDTFGWTQAVRFQIENLHADAPAPKEEAAATRLERHGDNLTCRDETFWACAGSLRQSGSALMVAD